MIAALTWILIGIAVVALLRRDMPYRLFLVGGIVGGLALLTFGYVGALTPPWAPALRDLLDGAAAALRNTHKFDVLLRLPLALALAHGLARISVSRAIGEKWTRLGLAFVAAVAVLGVATPGLAGLLPAANTFTAVPAYWRQAADYLCQRRRRALVARALPDQRLGRPARRAHPAAGRHPWAVQRRPAVVGGQHRMLNTVEQQLARPRLGRAGAAPGPRGDQPPAGPRGPDQQRPARRACRCR